MKAIKIPIYKENNPLKVPIAEHLIVDEVKTQNLLDVLTTLKCLVVDVEKTVGNPHGFMIEMKNRQKI